MPLSGTLGILAGGGELPLRLIEACRESGRPFFVIAFKGYTPPEIVADGNGEVPHAWVRLGAAGRTIKTLKRAGARELVLAGTIRRPGMIAVLPDLWAIRFLIRTGAGGLGDDGLLSAFIRALETEEGFRVVGVDDILPEIIAGEGVMGAHVPDDDDRRDIDRGIEAARELGARDEGQAVVIGGGDVMALEDAAGTDAMLARLADGKCEKGGVLVKISKPGQEMRADLPTIGPGTVAGAAAAGLRGIAVEAGRALVVDRQKVARDADAAGIFVVGVAVADGKRSVEAAGKAPEIFLIAGEASGDALGGPLMAALKDMTGGRVTFAGVGGPLMEAEGLRSLFPMNELAVMGLVEVLPRLPRLLGRIRQVTAEIRRRRPACVVSIDAPDFNFRVAKRLRGSKIPVVHYVAPTVWAWRPGRAAKIAPFIDHLLALLPFEPPYFAEAGLDCTFVGHPVVEGGSGTIDATAWRARHAVPVAATLLCLLPGSRAGEAQRLLPVFAATVEMIKTKRPDIRLVIPAAPAVAGMVRDAVGRWPVAVIIVEGEAEKAAAFAAADVALAASGTVSLELALAGTPMVIAYKISPLTHLLVRRMIRVKYACLINIILDREAVPECLQDDCRVDRLADEVEGLLGDEGAGKAQREAGRDALKKLGLGGPKPSGKAARTILNVIGNYKGTPKRFVKSDTIIRRSNTHRAGLVDNHEPGRDK